MIKRIPLGDMCVHKIGILSSQCCDEIEYIDISSVDNIQKKIVSSQIISTVDAPSRAKQLINKGDVLVSTVRPNLNAVAIVDRETDNTLVASTGYCILRTENEIHQKYIYYFCQSPYFVEDMVKQATGASYPAVSSNIVKCSLIPNYDEYEKKKIVTSLDKVSVLIDCRNQQLSKLDEFVKARFIELFGDCTNTVRLGDCCEVHARIGWQALTKNEHMKTGEYMLVTGTDFKDGEIDYSTCVYVAKERFEMDKHIILKNDDVLITKDGTIGKVAIVHNLCKPATLNAGVFVVRPDERFNKEYIANVFKGPLFSDYVEESKTGATIKHLNQKHLVEFMIPVPSLEQQEAFAQFTQQVDKSKLSIKQSLEKLETLKKSLMQQYFG